MKLNMKELNPGTWFDLDDGARICLRLCNEKDMAAIRAKTVKEDAEYINGQRYQTIDRNNDLAEEMTWDKSIIAWEGIIDENDEPVPCTKDNKILLMRGSLTFPVVVTALLDNLTSAVYKESEGLVKNSLTSPDGQSNESKATPAKSAKRSTKK